MLNLKPLALAAAAALTLGACEAPDLTATRLVPTAQHSASFVPPLTFPARIGVLRFVGHELTVAPEAERALFAENAPPIGDFVTLGPLETRLAGLRRLRLGSDELADFAAARSLDYLLILDLDPSRNTGEALFLHAATGHPFGSFETAAPGRATRNFWGNQVKPGPRRDRATARIAEQMVPGMVELLNGLAAQAK